MAKSKSNIGKKIANRVKTQAKKSLEVRKSGLSDIKKGANYLKTAAKNVWYDTGKAGYEGWNQPVDMSKVTAEVGNDVLSHKAANMLSSGVKGGVKSTVKQLVPNVIPGGFNIVKGVVKGIFNHPDWYQYKGNLSIPAYNANRPFDPSNMVPSSKDLFAPGAGVTHVIQQNVEFDENIVNEESFQLAMIDAFKEIRLDLKSNLPYDQYSYNNYIACVISIAIKAVACERTLGMYRYTRADIPELQDALGRVSLNTQEVGRLQGLDINMLKDDVYPNELNLYKKLQSILPQIAIPGKLMEYLRWWIGGIFIDQAAPNPQIYYNVLRKAPVFTTYSTDNKNVVIHLDKYWDIATGSIQDVINEALSLLNYAGIMNADITKTGRYQAINIANVEQYTPVFMNDPEFFSILINNYTLSRENCSLFSPEYIRVDALSELSEANLVGMANSLATWANAIVPCKIVSQAAYFTVSNVQSVAHNGTVALFKEASQLIENYDKVPSHYYFYQITSNMIREDKFNYSTSSVQVNTSFTADNRLSEKISFTPSTTELSMISIGNFMSTVDRSTLISNGADFTVAKLPHLQQSKYDYIVLHAHMIDENTLNFDIRAKSANGETGMIVENAAEGKWSATSVDTWTVVWNSRFSNIPTSTTGDEFNAVLDAVSIGAEQYTIITVSAVGTMVSSVIGLAELHYDNDIASFCEQVDYHLPIFIGKNTSIDFDTYHATIKGTTKLLKECYVPMIFNYADINKVLYWMYLGLFSMN